MEIIQIVGYKNSGKTTLAVQLIEYLTKTMGLRTASLKHHGHGGVPEGIKDTDSEKHKTAGALISGVEGAGLLQLSKESWKLNEIIEFYRLMQIDIVVIEGFKKYPFPKIVLIRKEEDLDLLEQVDNVATIITHIPVKLASYPYPIFHTSEINNFYQWLREEFIEQIGPIRDV